MIHAALRVFVSIAVCVQMDSCVRNSNMQLQSLPSLLAHLLFYLACCLFSPFPMGSCVNKVCEHDVQPAVAVVIFPLLLVPVLLLQ
jgi:hypothetical protein